MKIYNHGSYGRGTIIASPGKDHPENSDWIEPITKSAMVFTVQFKGGVADVPEGLGRYLIDKGLASRSPIILSAA